MTVESVDQSEAKNPAKSKPDKKDPTHWSAKKDVLFRNLAPLNSERPVAVETRPNPVLKKLLTENSFIEREKAKLKAELLDSKVYFFNDLRNEISKEEHAQESNQSFTELKDDRPSVELSEHVTIPGLDTFEVLNTDHGSFIKGLESADKALPFL
jgi:hypothetical protein